MAADYLADPSELADWLGVPASDAKLLRALGAASRRFRGAVRHPVTLVEDDAVTLDGNGRSSLLLPAAPVTAVTEVQLDGEVLVEGEDYDWSADGFLRRLCGLCWPNRLRCIDMVYSHGDAEVPGDIQEVVIDQARAIFTVLPGVQSRQVGGQSVTFGAQAATGVTAQWTAAVERHRIGPGDDA